MSYSLENTDNEIIHSKEAFAIIVQTLAQKQFKRELNV
jgi:hypothetical protein